MILTINTSESTARLGLLRSGKTVAKKEWEAGRELSIQLLPAIAEVLKQQNADWLDLKGVIVFAGPGSFTGLRIGFTVANTIAYSLVIPIASGKGSNWQKNAAAALAKTKPGAYVFPHYGAPVKITLPKAK